MPAPIDLEARKLQHSNVPCGDCRACCKRDRIVLGEKDDLAAFRWHFEGALRVLDRKPNGECTYLTAAGCGIHKASPDICKRFDCRVLFLITPKAQRRLRREQNPTLRAVYEAGKRRLSTL